MDVTNTAKAVIRAAHHTVQLGRRYAVLRRKAGERIANAQQGKK